MESTMNSPNSFNREQISALTDGQVQGDEFAHALAEVDRNLQSVQSWHLYHVIGDVMRSDALAPTTRELAFWERLEEKLAAEPVRMDTAGSDAPVATVQTSANDASVRWKWLAGVSLSALVALVVAGGWPLQDDRAAQLAKKESLPAVAPVAQVATKEDQPVMVRDPELDALMAAHQQLGGHSAFQMPSGFLRNATFERLQR
jgi:sigma-E factor negative regulatory protein RseA